MRLRHMTLTAVTAVVLSVAIAVPTLATFPGSNGRIAFGRETVAGDHTQVDIYSISADGTHRVRLTHTSDRNEFGAAWNAEGTRIAFWRTPAPFGPGSLWSMDGDGDNSVRLTHGVDARDPAWSPSGTRLVFTNVTGQWHLWTLRATDGGHLRRVTKGPCQDFEPAWSPDGSKIAFTRSFEQGDPGDIYVKDLTSGDVTRLTQSSAYDHQVTWSPSGDRLVFERDYNTASSVFVMDVNGSNLTRLTRGSHFDLTPAVSPDGQQIAFGSDRGTVLSDLWVMDFNGSNKHAIETSPAGEGEPDWQPTPNALG